MTARFVVCWSLLAAPALSATAPRHDFRGARAQLPASHAPCKASMNIGAAGGLLLADGANALAESASRASAMLPQLPSLDMSPELRESVNTLVLHAVSTAIDWAVPAAVVVAAFAVTVGRGEDDGTGEELLRQLVGRLSEPKELIKVDVYDKKLEAFDYSFTKATVSKTEAMRRKQLAELRRSFGTIGDLDPQQLHNIRKAHDRLRARSSKLAKKVAALLPRVRALAVDDGATAGSELLDGDTDEDIDDADVGGDKVPEADGEGGAPGMESAANATSSSRDVFTPRRGGGSFPQRRGMDMGVGVGMGLPFGLPTMSVAALEADLSKLAVEAVQLEAMYLAEVSAALTPAQRRKLKAAVGPQDQLSVRGGLGATAAGDVYLPPTWTDGTVDALSPIYSVHRRAGSAAGPHQSEGGKAPPRAAVPEAVFVLSFDGDIQASQVANLREEVTAVLQQASPGDEVVVRLNTGGGTVTGYGLAAAQLERVKAAGLELTVCVEQVAASGGYMMACTASPGRLFASPFAVVGSIGVISEQPNVYQRLKDEGITFLTVTAGKFKRTLTPFKRPTKQDFDKQKEDIEQVLVLFKSFVQRNRPQLDIDKVATGETWFGRDALERNLVDHLRTSDDVILDLVRNGASRVYDIKFDPALGRSPMLTLSGAESENEGTSRLQRGARGLVHSFARLVVSVFTEVFAEELKTAGASVPWTGSDVQPSARLVASRLPRLRSSYGDLTQEPLIKGADKPSLF